jgi:putative transposase
MRLRLGGMVLVVVRDWYSRSSVSWAVDDTLELPFVLEAARQALAQAPPVIGNTDQGSQFPTAQFTHLVLASGARRSRDGKGRALYTICTQRLWRRSKYDQVYLPDSARPREARQLLREFLPIYNERRRQQALGYRPAAELAFAAPAA